MHVPHENSNGKSALSLLAKPSHGTGVGDGAAPRNVPGRTGLGESRVAHVGAGLAVDADGIEGEEEGMHEQGDEGQEDVRDVHCGLDDQDEHGEDGDDDVVVCDAVTIRCLVCVFRSWEIGGGRWDEERTIDSRPWGRLGVESWPMRR